MEDISRDIKTIKEFWYLAVLLFMALVINENVVQWVLAVTIGEHTVVAGFKDAFKYFSVTGYFFCTIFRLVPYVLLGISTVILLTTKLRDYFLPVFIGGLIGILAMILWGSWMALRPYYTDEHMSSTTGLAFLFIPILAVPTGAISAALSACIYKPIRAALRRRKTEPTNET